MKVFLIRRLIASIPVLLGVYLITFLIFHLRDPLTIARIQMPQASLDNLHAWIHKHNYHLPLFINTDNDAITIRADGRIHPEFARYSLFHSRFFLQLGDLIQFNAGLDYNNQPIARMLARRTGPTLSIMLPAFGCSILISILMAYFSAYAPGSILDRILNMGSMILLCMALPILILGGYYLLGNVLKIAPIYRHLSLPVLIGCLANLGAQYRLYRSAMLQETGKDYTRTALLKGAPTGAVIRRHVLRNSLLPIATISILSIPYLIAGSVLLEQFAGIPGLGDYLYRAIVRQDFKVIQSLVYIGSIAYIFSSLLADISYAFIDPRIRIFDKEMSL